MVDVAQLVEPRVVIPVVVGSNPIVHPRLYTVTVLHAKVAELVDALDLGSSGATRESSSLSFRTTTQPEILSYLNTFMRGVGMSVSVETLAGLERKLTLTIPAAKIEEEVDKRLKKYTPNTKVPGFRPGKVPVSVMKQRYSHSIREEVVHDLVPNVLGEALQKETLLPAGTPHILPGEIKEGHEFIFSATFEVMPKIDVVELSEKDEIEWTQAEVKDADIEQLTERLRSENKIWTEVSRSAKKGDRVTLDFAGFIEGKPFDGGDAKDFQVILGDERMIPGFEEGIVGADKTQTLTLDLAFPEDYSHQALAGKPVKFKVTLHQIEEGELPEIDEAFAEQFNVKEGGVEALKKELRESMERELANRVNFLNREKVFALIRERNEFQLPNVLVNREIEHLKHEFYHQVFGNEHHENEKIPDFPRSLFEEKAKNRVHLGLVFAAYVEKHDLKASTERVDEKLEQMIKAYENPEEMRSFYRQNKERLSEVQSLVLEEIVAEKMKESAKTKEKILSYEEVMYPKKKTEAEIESTGA